MHFEIIAQFAVLAKLAMPSNVFREYWRDSMADS